MVEVVGRAINYKVLSWDGVLGSSTYLAKQRGLEVLKAREKVDAISEAQWCQENLTKPGYVPTLLEQMAYKGLSCTALCMKMRRERDESAARRKGVKVNHDAPVDMDDLRKTVQI